jgi:hypothetical protein
MQRRILVFCLTLCMVSLGYQSRAQRGKSEIAIGYGYWSSFSITNHAMNGADYGSSSGSGVIAYRYYISRQVTLGAGFGYENISTWGNFATIAPEVTVAYLDTRKTAIRIRMYGSISYGVTLFGDNVIGLGEADQTGAKPWGLQASPFGIRIGRQFAGFLEVGYGYKGLLHGGLELRFPHILVHKEHPVE